MAEQLTFLDSGAIRRIIANLDESIAIIDSASERHTAHDIQIKSMLSALRGLMFERLRLISNRRVDVFENQQ